MPFLLLFVGVIIVVAAIRNTLSSLAGHLQEDLAAKQNGVSFWVWVAAIVLIGSLGYIPQFETPARALLFLVGIVVLLKNGAGFFAQLMQQIEHPPAATVAPASVPSNLPAIPVASQAGAVAGAQAGGSIGS